MKIIDTLAFYHKSLRRKSLESFRGVEGFATAQFVMLVGFTLLLLTTFVNVLIVENTRATTLASLREAARAGTKTYDLRRVESLPEGSQAEYDCVQKFIDTMNQISPALTTGGITCTIIHDTSNGNDRFYMKASIASVGGLKLVPWATAFSGRMENLSATFTPAEAAK